MKLAASLHSQTTASATSSTVPMRPIGCILRQPFGGSSAGARDSTRRSTMGVGTNAGQTALTRMPGARVLEGGGPGHADRRRACWRCRRRSSGKPISPASEAVLTIAPPPCSQHLARLVLEAQPHARQVDRQDAIEGWRDRPRAAARAAPDAGVVVGIVEPPEALDGGRDERLDLLPRRSRRPRRSAQSAQGSDLTHRVIAARRVHVGDDRRTRPARAKASAEARPMPEPGASDERDADRRKLTA